MALVVSKFNLSMAPQSLNAPIYIPAREKYTLPKVLIYRRWFTDNEDLTLTWQTH